MLEKLKQAGLTQVEARIYLGLLDLGNSKASKISSYLKIPTSNLYFSLESLREKGLISISFHNNVKFYEASKPETLKILFEKEIDKIKNDEKELLEEISKLKLDRFDKTKKESFHYFEKTSGLKAMWLSLINSMNKNEENKLHVGNPLAYENLEGFYNLYHEKRVKLNVPTRIIFDPRDKTLANKRKSKNLQIKFQQTNSLCEWGIIGDKFFMQHKDKAFLIEDDKFVKTFSEMFDKIWYSINE